MDTGRTSSGDGRIVVLSHDVNLLASVNTRTEFECLQSATTYEAAAEILAGPTIALVIDLRLLTMQHLGLLEIARQRPLEMLGVGAVSPGLTAEDLSGVRLVSRRDLASVLAGLAAAHKAGELALADIDSTLEQTAQEQLRSQQLADRSGARQVEAQRLGVSLTPAKPPRDGVAERVISAPDERDSAAASGDSAPPPSDDAAGASPDSSGPQAHYAGENTDLPGGPSSEQQDSAPSRHGTAKSLLTSEEISALLGDLP